MNSSFVLTVAMTVLAQGEPAQVFKPGAGVSAPRVLQEVKPVYPPDAMFVGLEGTVLLECVVTAEGTVGDVRVRTSLYPSLDDAAIAAVKQWRFRPGSRDGKPVPVAVDVELTFTLGAGKGPKLDSADVFKPGPDVTAPRVLQEVKAVYTDAARQAGIEGTVRVECIVLPDGTVGRLRLTKRLDPGLDVEAVKALRRWRFAPGLRNGQPVPVQVTIEQVFTLK
jgi:TonB family protein